MRSSSKTSCRLCVYSSEGQSLLWHGYCNLKVSNDPGCPVNGAEPAKARTSSQCEPR